MTLIGLFTYGEEGNPYKPKSASHFIADCSGRSKVSKRKYRVKQYAKQEKESLITEPTSFKLAKQSVDITISPPMLPVGEASMSIALWPLFDSPRK